MSAPNEKQHAADDDSENRRHKRKKEKLIRLDDLIPKKDVKGGHQIFGVTDTTETDEKEK